MSAAKKHRVVSERQAGFAAAASSAARLRRNTKVLEDEPWKSCTTAPRSAPLVVPSRRQ